MNFKRPLSALVVSAVIVASPGLFAWEASAQVVRGPAPVAAGAVGAWGAAVGRLATAVQIAPALSASAPGLAPVLGRLRLEISLRPLSHAQAQAALSFVARLPDAAAQPEVFASLPLAERVKIIDAAIAATSGELQPRAELLLSREAKGTLSKDDRIELDRIAARWFYLAPATAAAVKTSAAAARAGAALSLAGRLARALTREKMESPAAVVHSELAQVFSGAAELTAGMPAEAKPNRLVPSLLAPYVVRALDEAEVRARERGASEGSVAKRIIENHIGLFGRVADRDLFGTLRARGEWSEFVAAVSLHAAERLGAMGEEGRLVLAKAGEGDELRLAIPDWHPLFGRYASIAEWLTDAHGKPDDSDDLKGMPFFTAFGIPVLIERSLWPALIITALQFSSMFLTATPGFGPIGHFSQGLALTALLYLSVLGHEFGHAVAAHLFGIRTKKIILNFLGGGAEIVRGFRQALPEFVIALAGPIVSALIGASALALAALLHNPVATPILLFTGKLNLILAALNMLPLFPMDGARVLRAALTRLFGSYRATRFVGLVSAALSLLLMANGVNVYLLGGSVATALIRFAFGAYFLSMSKAMAVHPGTATVDEKSAK
jgi:Zn-dependent protease